MASTSNDKFIWLDFIRGLSAIAVCASHLRAALFIDFSGMGASSAWQKAFYAATGLGHQAVVVFFVLSGFFVGGSVLKSGARFNPRKYAFLRLSRLWVVLVPALLFTAAVDRVIGVLAPGVLAGAFDPVWNSGPVSASEYSASVLNFFANLLFLQTVLTPVFGTNGPLWSLANEFWYYVLFPICAMAIGWVGPGRSGSSWLPRVALGVVAVVLLVVLPRAITEAYPIWLLGLLAFLMIGRVGRTARHVLLVAGLAAFVLALAYSKSANLQARYGLSADVLIGIGFCLLCSALANMGPPRRPESLFVRTSQGMSAFSYSLYLVHFPLVALIGATLYGTRRMAPDATGLLEFTGWLALLLAAGAGFWWLFERRTDVLRRAMASVTRIA